MTTKPMPREPSYDVLRRMCGDPLILAATYEIWAREAYAKVWHALPEAQDGPAFTTCHFVGPAPTGYTDWRQWCSAPIKTGARISALPATQDVQTREDALEEALKYLFISTAPDGQWADQAVHSFVNAILKINAGKTDATD